VAKLYLPPGDSYFGCRHCHALAYTSCQESGRFTGLFRYQAASTGYDVATVKRAMKRMGKEPR
jgi:hypothetical protein